MWSTCDTSVAFEFQDVVYGGGAATLKWVILQDSVVTDCVIENYAMDSLPAGGTLDAATGIFTWSPAPATPSRALIDEGSTYTAESTWSNGGPWDDPKLTSALGFHNQPGYSNYWGRVTFPGG